MYQCTKGELEVRSDSSNKTYTIRAHGRYGLPDCSCTAYGIARNRKIRELGLTGKGAEIAGTCKHLNRHLGELCEWQGNDRVDGECPKCGAPIVRAMAEYQNDGRLKGTHLTQPSPVANAPLMNAQEIDVEAERVKASLTALLESMGK